jgi:hypothetical protein
VHQDGANDVAKYSRDRIVGLAEAVHAAVVHRWRACKRERLDESGP